MPITRREWLASTAAASLLPAQTSRPRPNVLVIVVDDMGIGDLGCFGAADAKTPHFDQLAREGIRFTDWHANSPVCSPSRASLLTGKYPQHCGIPQILTSKPDFEVPGLRQGEHTLASELKRAGYRTAALGKWHLGSAKPSRPLAQGFDSWFGFYSGWIDYYSHRYYTLGGQPLFHDLWRNGTEVFEDGVYQTELLGREATKFLDGQSASQPFFLYLAFGAPHYPMMAPQQYVERFPASMDRDRRMHCAMIAAIDDQIGAIRKTLAARGLTNNTVIYFQSDNGATHEVRADHLARPYEGGSNKPYRAWKGSLFEGGMRVPAMLAWPGTIKPRVENSTLVAMDIMPTMLKLAGAPIPNDVDGMDISAHLLDAKPAPSRTIFWDYAGQTAARNGEWKLVLNHGEGLGSPIEKGTKWLSNLATDPRETHNFITEKPEISARLADEIATWKAKYP